MPYRVEKKHPLDLSKRQAIGVQIPFSSKSVFIPTYQTIDAYKTNLINFFSTTPGERYLNPTFGCSLNKLLFEQALPVSQLRVFENRIKDELRIYFPKLVIDTFNLNVLPDSNTVQLYIKFHIKDSFLEDELTLTYE